MLERMCIKLEGCKCLCSSSINAIEHQYQNETKSGEDLWSSLGFWGQHQMENRLSKGWAAISILLTLVGDADNIRLCWKSCSKILGGEKLIFLSQSFGPCPLRLLQLF